MAGAGELHLPEVGRKLLQPLNSPLPPHTAAPYGHSATSLASTYSPETVRGRLPAIGAIATDAGEWDDSAPRRRFYNPLADPNLSGFWERRADLYKESKLIARQRRLQRDRRLAQRPRRRICPTDPGDSPRQLASHRSAATSLFSGNTTRARGAVDMMEIAALRTLHDPPPLFQPQVRRGMQHLQLVDIGWLRKLEKGGDCDEARRSCKLNLSCMDTESPADGRPRLNSPRSILVLLRNGCEVGSLLPHDAAQLRLTCELEGIPRDLQEQRSRRLTEARTALIADLRRQYQDLCDAVDLRDVLALLRKIALSPKTVAMTATDGDSGEETERTAPPADVIDERRKREAGRIERRKQLRQRCFEQELQRQEEESARQIKSEQLLQARTEERLSTAAERAKEKGDRIKARNEQRQCILDEQASEQRHKRELAAEADRVREARLRGKREREREALRVQSEEHQSRISKAQQFLADTHEERLQSFELHLKEVARKAAIIEQQKQEAAAIQERKRSEATQSRRAAATAKAAEVLEARRTKGEERQRQVEERLEMHSSQREQRRRRRQRVAQEKAERREQVREAAVARQERLRAERVALEDLQAANFLDLRSKRRKDAMTEQERLRLKQQARLQFLGRRQKAREYEKLCRVAVLSSKTQRVEEQQGKQEEIIRRTRQLRERIRVGYEVFESQLEDKAVESSKRTYAALQAVTNPRPVFKKVVG
eukprot:TRINITY_DN5207_c0_g1_i1.p1 TRINITY_DN5207_c0_g1~~TRINITY_DN5207_c0_g1_i1.p1  ORF type:complete len:733 (+),score=286.08 TRINITY_DN5207_c0_g1_i1:54-2201(+)